MRRAAALGILLFMPLCAWGCSVPVFMFALENWKGSPHTLRVAAADMNAAERLLGAGRANLMIVLADNVAAGQADLCYPGDDRPWATMSLTQADPGAITESPARTEIARRLLAGDAVVWLLLDSGDAEVDARTRALLKERLDNIAAAVVLHRQANPALDPADAMQGEPPVVKIVFATVEVHANDPAEIWLVREIDHLAPSTGGPRLVPIFGRARALTPLSGAGISAQAIDDATSFLCGDCSCQAQLSNPGHELLLAADWDQRPGETPGSNLPAAERPEVIHIVPPVETIAVRATNTPSAMSKTGGNEAPPMRNLILSLIPFIVVLAGVVTLMKLYRRSNRHKDSDRMP